MTNEATNSDVERLKPGKYAILYRDNWDGEGDTYHTLANFEVDGRWLSDETGKELLEYEGDEILKAWPLDDGADTIGLIAALEQEQEQEQEQAYRKSAFVTANLWRDKFVAAEQRIAELESQPLCVKLPDGSKPSVIRGGQQSTAYRAIMSGYGDWLHKDMVIEAIRAAGGTVEGE